VKKIKANKLGFRLLGQVMESWK